MGELSFKVNGLISLAYTETYARLMRAYHDEMSYELNTVRGLPKGLLYDAMKEGIDRVAQRWLQDCGYPVPDSGKLYPQLSNHFGSVIPQGYQTEALTQILEAEPQIKRYLQQEINKPPAERYGGRSFDQVLKDLQAQYSESFTRFQWVDEFAPPDCVRPIKDSNPMRPPRPAGRSGPPASGPPPGGRPAGPPGAGPQSGGPPAR